MHFRFKLCDKIISRYFNIFHKHVFLVNLGKPRKCMVPKMADCSGTDSVCQYYFNPRTSRCEKGAAGHGFQSLTQCYDKCSGKYMYLKIKTFEYTSTNF